MTLVKGILGSPVVKTLCFHCRERLGFDPDWETKFPQATWRGQKNLEKRD